MKKTDAFAVFFLYFLLYFGFGFLAAALKIDALILQCAFTLAAGALPFLYAAFRRIPFKAFFSLGGFSLALLAGALLCMAGSLILSGVAQLIMSFFIHPSALKGTALLERILLSYPRPLVFAASALLPAICEEALFRGFILSALRQPPNGERVDFKQNAFAIMLCSLLFAAAHMDIARFFSAFIAGLAISYVACSASSLSLAMVMHFFNNASALALYFLAHRSLQDGDSPENALSSPPFVGLKMLSHVAILLILAIALSTFLIFAGARVIRANRQTKATLQSLQ